MEDEEKGTLVESGMRNRDCTTNTQIAISEREIEWGWWKYRQLSKKREFGEGINEAFSCWERRKMPPQQRAAHVFRLINSVTQMWLRNSFSEHVQMAPFGKEFRVCLVKLEGFISEDAYYHRVEQPSHRPQGGVDGENERRSNESEGEKLKR